MNYGYARVSTDDQNTALQLAALKKAGCKTIFTDEGISGATVKRPALTRSLKALRPGDTLIVWKLDRLGRSLRDLIIMLDEFRAQGVKLAPCGRTLRLARRTPWYPHDIRDIPPWAYTPDNIHSGMWPCQCPHQ